MLRSSRFVGAALACWVALAGASMGYGQPQNRQERREERRGAAAQTQAPAQRTTTEVRDRNVRPVADDRSDTTLRARSILGSKMSLRGGTSIGTVDDIVFSRDGVIDYLLVRNEGKYVVVPWQAAKFDLGQRTATVNITQEQFRQVPTYTQERLPNFYGQTFRQQTYGYYGLRPGQERRLERREGIPRP
jgi:hypothetical protein